jgi:hypothetical protein
MPSFPVTIGKLVINLTRARSAALLTILALTGAFALAGCGGGSEGPSAPAHYHVKIYNGWPQETDEEQVGRYLENEWYDPADNEITITIDSRIADETGSPIANAELARIQTANLPHYRERGLKRIRLGGRPTVQWAYDLAGESRLAFFFEECGTDFLVRGRAFMVEPYAGAFREMASTIKVACDE